MTEKTHNQNFHEYYSVIQITYATCILSVLLVAILLWNKNAENARVSSSKAHRQLLTRDELQEFQNSKDAYYPPEWRILKQLGNQRQNRTQPQYILTKPVFDSQQTTQDLNAISRNLQLRAEKDANRQLSPILWINQQNHQTEQTFQATDLKSFEQTDRHSQTPPKNVQCVGKPEIENANPEVNASDASILDKILEIAPFPENEAETINARVGTNVQKEDTISSPIDRNMDKNMDKKIVHTSPARDTNSRFSEMNYNHQDGLKILRFFNQKAQKRLETFSRDIRDYSCTLYKWDTTNNVADGNDVMEIKLRETPYSIYAKSTYPHRYEGREWLYWEGHYDNLMIVNSGPRLWNRTIPLSPDSTGIKNCASRSVLQLGFRRLLEELIEISANETTFEKAIILYYPHSKVGDTPCYTLEVTFPEKSDVADFYRIQIYVDEKLDLPIQLIIYDWPEGDAPALVRESYTYIIKQLNPGFNDKDFCHLNEEYKFRKYIPHLSETEQAYMQSLFQKF